jgi:hypothetical protein
MKIWKLMKCSAPRVRPATAVVVGVAVALFAGCESERVEIADAQNPMGDEATAAAGSETPDPEVRGAAATQYVGGWNLPYVHTASAATTCMRQRSDQLHDLAADTTRAAPGHRSEDPAYAASRGWYPNMPEFLDGSILPCARVVAYYGNPNSTRMGALGRYPKDEMLGKLMNQVAEWERADPGTPVVPALHMVSVVANDQPGPSGHYRTIMRDSDVQKVHEWAREVNGIFFVDIQVGTDDIRNILPRFEWILKEPDVHLGIDPEFMMKDGSRPGTRIGTMDAADINYAAEYLARLVRENDLPPKIFVVHRFTQRMVTNYQNVRLHPEVHLVMHMDGWGEAWLKRDSFEHFVVREPVQFSGFKIFYDHDSRQGNPVMAPAELVQLHPVPLYVQYQ